MLSISQTCMSGQLRPSALGNQYIRHTGLRSSKLHCPALLVRPSTHPFTGVSRLNHHTSIIASSSSSTRPEQPKQCENHHPLKSILTTVGKIGAVAALAIALTLGSVSPAEAARSGGRMGGSAFSSSRAYSPSSSSLGGGSFGRGLGSSTSSSFGRNSMYLSSPSLKSSRSTLGRSITMNSFFFSPWGFGMGYGYGYGGGFTSLLFWGVFAAIMFNVLRGVMDGNGGGALESGGDRVTVAKVQVGLLGSARDMQRDLERIAGRADTTSADGLHYVLQETVLSLMRNPEYCIYGFAKAGVENSPEAGEARFNKLSLEERGKFEKETLVNVGGRSRRGSLGGSNSSSSSRGGNPINELIVVTILVAAEGRVKLPKVTSRTELRDALTTLGGLRASDILAVEVLWTPEEEGDYFTRDELAFDYPLLNTL